MQSKTVNVTEVVESSSFVGLPLRIVALMFFIMLVDGFDLTTMSYIAPVLTKGVSDGGWGITRDQLGPVLAASMIGMGIGSIALGWLGDRIGRKASYVICIMFLLAGSTLSAISTGLNDLFAYRLLTGIGLGGVTPLAATLISEWTSKRARSLAVVCVIVAVPFGGLVGAEVAKLIIPAFGWRTIFWIGAAFPLLFLVLAQLLLVESPKFMALDPKRHKALAKALNVLVKEKRFTGEETFIVGRDESVGAAKEVTGNWFAAIMKPPLLYTTLLLWVAFTANSMALYSFVNWMPTMLTSTGLPTNVGLSGSTWFNVGGVSGAVAGAFLIRFFGSRLVGTTASTIGAIACVLLGMGVLANGIQPDAKMYFLIAIAGLALNGMQSFVYAVGANSYPITVRAAGVGTAQTVSRIGGAIITFEGAKIFPSINSYFFIIAGIMVFVILSYVSLRTHLNSTKRGLQLEAEAIRDGAQA